LGLDKALSYIPTAEGFLYLAGDLDLYSRRLVGWAMADTLDRTLVIDALQIALLTRKPKLGLIHHSALDYLSPTQFETLPIAA
jgi:transposase InsO family protein